MRLWRVTGNAGKTGTDRILREDLLVAVFFRFHENSAPVKQYDSPEESGKLPERSSFPVRAEPVGSQSNAGRQGGCYELR